MVASNYILGIAVFGAIAFLLVQNRDFFKTRPIIKTVMGVALGVYCIAFGTGPLVAMGFGFIFSAVGDAVLDVPGDKYFVPGLCAFFTAHVIFFGVLQPHASWSLPVCILVGLFTLGFFMWLKPSLEKKLVVPVAAYAVVIALMGMAALTTTLGSVWIPLGAALFIASDVVLAVERFKFKFTMDKTINWILYASGQIALAIGVVSSLSL